MSMISDGRDGVVDGALVVRGRVVDQVAVEGGDGDRVPSGSCRAPAGGAEAS